MPKTEGATSDPILSEDELSGYYECEVLGHKLAKAKELATKACEASCARGLSIKTIRAADNRNTHMQGRVT